MQRLLLVLFALAVGLAPAAWAIEVEETDLFLIKVSDELVADVATAVTAAGGELKHDMSDIGYYTAYSESPDFADLLVAIDGIEAVDRDLSIQWIPTTEPAVTGEISDLGPITDPNLAFYRPCQWNLDQINAAGAWAQGAYGTGVTVAVLDGGVSGDFTGGCSPHQDLIGKVVGNVSMLSVPTICDLFVPDQATGCDFRFHGTFVAGQIAAHGFGIAGVAPDANIYGVKVLSCQGSGSFGDVIAGIMHAANQPMVDVINMSLGAYFPKNLPGAGPLLAAMNKAVNYAQGVMGKLVVSAAGNDGANLGKDGNFVSLPAEAGSGVSAWAGDFYGNLASYTNYGVAGAQLGAGGGDGTPGVFIPACPLPAFGHDGIVSVCSPDSIFFGCGFGSYLFNGSGTSFSAPIVAGVGALAKGVYPSKNGNQLKTHLMQTADDLGKKGVDKLYSHGRVNADNAVK